MLDYRPGDPRLGTLQRDDLSRRNGNPPMSSTDQQAEVPAEHAVPEDLALAAEFDAITREQWRDLVVWRRDLGS